MNPLESSSARSAIRRVAAVNLAVGLVLHVATGSAQDLWISPVDQSDIRINVFADPQCPIACGNPNTPCCDNFSANVSHLNTRVPDLTMLNGDLTIDSHDPLAIDQFLDRWNSILGEKHFILGNHEADPNENFFWADSTDHYVPAVLHEPLFAHGTPDYRRWYSIYVGNPPRVAVFGLSNCSDSYTDDDVCYLFCTTPNDFLNHEGSEQRTWLEGEIDALPSTVVSVLVCLHRTYYGVENYLCRPNIRFSGADFGEAPAETLRTGSVSFLRVLESIPDRTNVERVIVASGDQHCFAITHPIRMNARDDERGIPYIVLGGGGAPIMRSTVYPAPGKIPAGLLIDAFDDKWFNTTFRFKTDEIRFTVREAYSDTLLYETAWPLTPTTDSAIVEAAAADWRMDVRPRPVSIRDPEHLRIQLRSPEPSFPIERFAIMDVGGRRIRRLASAGSVLRNGDEKTWDLRDDAGKRVAPGVYMAVLRSGDRTVSEKIVVLE